MAVVANNSTTYINANYVIQHKKRKKKKIAGLKKLC
jgi:hypothetical protein